MVKKIKAILEIIKIKIFLNNNIRYEKLAEQQSTSSKLNSYIMIVNEAVNNDSSFIRFKKSRAYKEVLEHVDINLASQYYSRIKDLIDNEKNFNQMISKSTKNDLIGAPELFNFERHKISGTTLRYLYVFLHIKKVFKNKKFKRIIEIGGGYGGQCLIYDLFSDIDSYKILDLPSVNNLSKKYLNHHYLNCSFDALDVNNFFDDEFDLCISNYAFSELPRKLQDIYMNKVIKKSKHLFMIMNTGNDSKKIIETKKYKYSDLLKLFPDLNYLDEDPISSKDNYIIFR